MLRKGLPAKLANTDAGDTRYDFRNFVVCNSDGTARGGVTSPVGSVLSSTATMNVTVAAFSGVAARDGGAVLLSSDGPVSVLLNAAPSANSRIDVITARQNDSSSTVSTPDGSDVPQFIVLQGTAAASPVRPTVPDGSLDLGSVLIPSTATATNSAGVVISAPAQFTAAAGGAVPFLSKSALDLWATAGERQRATVTADPSSANNGEYARVGSSWVRGGAVTVTDANGWSYQTVGGKRAYVQKFPGWAGLAFGPFGGSNSTQARASVSPPVGRSWDEFRVDVDVWPTSTGSNAPQAVIRGYLTNMTGTAGGSLIYYNPTAVSVPNTFMSLVGSVTLTEL